MAKKERVSVERARMFLVKVVSKMTRSWEPPGFGRTAAQEIAQSILQDPSILDTRAVYLAGEFDGLEALLEGCYKIPESCESPLVCATLYRIENATDRGGVNPSVRDEIWSWGCTKINCNEYCPINPYPDLRIKRTPVDVDTYRTLSSMQVLD